MAVVDLAPGVAFARDFVIVRPLSEGGMGVVYVALQQSTGRQRALKVMQPDLLRARDPAATARNRERFLQEARIGGRIHSEHVVEVVAAGVDEASGAPWLAMELLDGQDLATVLAERKRLPLAEWSTRPRHDTLAATSLPPESAWRQDDRGARFHIE